MITEIILDKASEILLLENCIQKSTKSLVRVCPAPEKIRMSNQMPKEEEVELELSLSDAVSFGK